MEGPKQKVFFKKLTASLIQSTEELTIYLQEDPEKAKLKIQDIQELCNNFFYLLNELR